MTTYTVLIILSGLVIFSYLFDLFASKTKLPSVLLLLLLGIGLRVLVDKLGIQTYNFLQILPALGTVGLILIVFEGSLELKYAKEKNKIIKGAFYSALFILAACTAVITLIIYQITGKELYLCFVNAIPFSVISSAIAIPSVANTSKKTKEFIIYESSFSDILSIIVFNFAISNANITFGSFGQLAINTGLMLFLSVIACLALIYSMGKLKHNVKFFLIISILILLYAVAQSFNLSALVLILSFGLFLNNADAIKHVWFRSKFIYKNLSNDLTQLHQLSAESAFILRTFFFVIFGFTINLSQLNNFETIINGVFILCSIYIIRFLYLYFFKKEHIVPEAFIAPRGLISILIYYNLPQDMRLSEIGTPYLFLVVLGSSLIMSIGLMASKKVQDVEAAPAE